MKRLIPALLIFSLGALAQPAWDNYSDTWVATDALGRKVAYHQDPRADRTVAMFYFLWLGPHASGGPFDITKILTFDPGAMQKPDSPLWGPQGAYHYWGEPLFGYYLSDDEWVLRRHAQTLADAGIDTLIFDTSNKDTYPQQYLALMKAFSEERKAGNKAPYVAFLTPFWDPKSTVTRLWNELYSKGLYKDLWFQWEGKPLILADPAKVDPALLSFFTFRNPQPSYFVGPTGPNMWSWLEVYPQHVFRNERGEKEQMSVGVAQNAVDGKLAVLSNPRSLSRSYHNGTWDKSPGAVLHGYNFAEQWEHALKEDPRSIFITGWNEWIAMRLSKFNGVSAPVMFVDEADQEHSRDIEPMKGGHGDAYYYQMADYVRRYKGSRKPPVAGAERTIDITGDFSQWKDVAPDYRDTVGDVYPRNHPGWNTVTRFINTTGRNDLVLMKISRDARNVYFYAKTADKISPYTDPNWMMLFIDIDRDHATGWEGYDYVVNRRVKDTQTTFLEHTRTGWNWQPKAEVRYAVKGNELMIVIPRKALGIGDGPIQFEFKWADNIQNENSIEEFTLNGDAAPPGRFNYLYSAQRGPQASGQGISRMYVFGDSYSDTGAGYLDGNGPTAVAYLADRLGFKLALPNEPDANSQSLNFAVSGAQTGRGAGQKMNGALLGRGMVDQVEDFTSRVRSRAIVFDSRRTLFFLAGGLNDGRLPSAETVANLKGEIRTLYSAGARRFRLALLPIAIPGFSEVGKRLNPELERIPREIEAALPGAQVRLSHWGPFFDEVMRNPSAYGIRNTHNACAGRTIFKEDATPCSNPGAYYYYHSGHPSTAVHKIVGDKLYAEIYNAQ